MAHTATIRYDLQNRHNFDIFKDSITSWEVRGNALVTKQYTKQGFNEIVLLQTTKPYKMEDGRTIIKTFYFLYVLINFSRYSGNSNLISAKRHDSFSLEHIDLFLGGEISLLFYKDDILESEMVDRFDYSIDMYIDEYHHMLILMNRGYQMPAKRKMTHYCFKDDTGKIISDKETVYIKSGSVTINLYSKECEQKNHNLYHSLAQEDKQRIKNLVRFEVSAHKGKLDNIVKKYGLGKRFLDKLFSDDIERKILLEYVSELCGSGRYVKYREAEKIIHKSHFSIGYQDVLLQILKLVAHHQGIARVQNLTDKSKLTINMNGTVKLLKKDILITCLKDIESLGISPVVIPRDWNMDTLENPCSLIKKHYEELKPHPIREHYLCQKGGIWNGYFSYKGFH